MFAALLCWAAFAARVFGGEDPAGRGGTNGYDDVEALPSVEVSPSNKASRGGDSARIDPSRRMPGIGDAAEALRGAPGADFASNGPLSRQTHYRGMFGPRNTVDLDGMRVAPGGPNWMDPPLHYAPRSLIGSIEVNRGIAPVSAGAETIGGAIDVDFEASRFTESAEWTPQGRLTGNIRSADEGFQAGGWFGAGSRHHRVHVLGGGMSGGDVAFQADGDEEIVPTEHEQTHVGVGYGYRSGGHEFSVRVRRHDTDNSGNPSLPMDIRFLDTNLANAKYESRFGDVELEARAFWSGIDHGMDNFSLRRPPDFFTPPPGAPPPAQAAFGGTDRRFVLAEADSFGGALEGTAPMAGGEATVGADVFFERHNMRVFDPDSPFFAEPFNDVRRDRFSAFGEWSGDLAGRWSVTAGARYARVESEAGRGDAPPLGPAQALEQAFNRSDRTRGEDLVDWAVEFERPISERATFRLGFARKSRAPSYLERFAWLPLEATAGFADGNNHVGDLDLDPEIAREVDAGIDWRSDEFYFTPRVFYRYVDDYIQGTPTSDANTVAVSTVNGDRTPLQYANVEAEFFGFDAGFGYRLSRRWRIDGAVNYVRAKRLDIDDDIFRVPPLNGTVSLTREAGRWSVTIRSVWAAAQDNVSRTNGEPPTDGYAIFNALARYRLSDRAEMRFGVENVFDDFHRDHLAGFNRVAESDVGGPTAPPARSDNRIPGTGRNFTAAIDYRW